jgi:hypothetical protein
MTIFFPVQFKKLMTSILKTGKQKVMIKMRKRKQQCASQFQHVEKQCSSTYHTSLLAFLMCQSQSSEIVGIWKIIPQICRKEK